MLMYLPFYKNNIPKVSPFTFKDLHTSDMFTKMKEQ